MVAVFTPAEHTPAATAWWASGHNPPRLRGRAAWTGSAALVLFALLEVSGVIAALGDTLSPARRWPRASRKISTRLQMFSCCREFLAPRAGGGRARDTLLRVRCGGTARKLAGIVMAIMLIQVAAGAMTLLLLAPVCLQLMHLLLADLLRVAMVLLVAERSELSVARGNRA